MPMQPFDLRIWEQFSSTGGDTSQLALIDQVVIDSRRVSSVNSLFVALPGRHQDGHHFVAQAAKQGARYALVQHSFQPADPIPNLILLHVDDTLLAMQQIAAAYRQQISAKVVGITGSMGKTMVKDLLHAILAKEYAVIASPESFNSQIGVAMSLFQIENTHQIALIEAGVTEVGDMKKLIAMIAPDHAILTNISLSHLGSLNSQDQLLQEKSQLLHAVPENEWVILPHEFNNYFKHKNLIDWDGADPSYPHAIALGTLTTNQHVPYRIKFPDDNTFTGSIPGGHGYLIEHINIAIKAAWLLGASGQAICQTLTEYTFQPIRVERWKTLRGGTIINERYSSDISSIEVALRALRHETKYHNKFFLLNGLPEERQLTSVEYQQIVMAIRYAELDKLLIVGEKSYQNLLPYLTVIAEKMPIKVFQTHTEALQYIFQVLKNEDLLLIKGATKIPIEELERTLDGAVCDNKLIINLAAIEDNLYTIRKALPKETRIMAMIKALGYGTDSLSLGHFLEQCGVDIVGVAHVDEAITLKLAGLSQTIFSIHMTEDEATSIISWDIEVAVSDLVQVTALQQIALQQNKIAKVHLHIDTGMGRLGCRPEATLQLAKAIQAFSNIQLEGVMTHLAASDVPADDAFTEAQLNQFYKVIDELNANHIVPKWIHATNSSGTLRFNLPRCNMVRIGLGLFGLAAGPTLRPALSLVSRLVGINEMKQGESIGYGHTYTVKRKTERIGVLPLGYFDGLHTQYSGNGFVLVRGQRAPFVGRICMDFMMVDITDIPDATMGDPVLVFGKDETGHMIDPAEVATRGNTHVYQLITCLGPRIRRLFIYDEGL